MSDFQYSEERDFHEPKTTPVRITAEILAVAVVVTLAFRISGTHENGSVESTIVSLSWTGAIIRGAIAALIYAVLRIWYVSTHSNHYNHQSSARFLSKDRRRHEKHPFTRL